MTLIGAKRLQQGVFEAAAGANRTAGSGGGSGLGAFLQLVGAIHGGLSVGNGVGTMTNVAYQVMVDFSAVSASVTFSVPRAASHLVLGVCAIQNQLGASVAQIKTFVDGSAPSDTPLILGVSTGAVGSYWSGPLLYTTLLQPGNHTIDARIHCGGNTYNIVSFDLYVFRMG